MAKLSTSDLANLQNETTAVVTINNNFAAVETAMENTLSRDGTSPNTMNADLDMNGNNILNLPTATTATEPVRLDQMQDAIEDLENYGLAMGTIIAATPVSTDYIPFEDVSDSSAVRKATIADVMQAGSAVTGEASSVDSEIALFEGTGGANIKRATATGLVAASSGVITTGRTITAPAAGITVSNGDGVAGNPTLALANDLAAYEGLSTTGLVARTGDGTATTRTLTAPAAGITVSNGNGVSGNPTLALANDLAGVEGLSSTGLVRRTGVDAWSAGTTVATAEIADNAVTDAKLRDGSGCSVIGRSAAASGDPADIQAVSDGLVLRRASNVLGFGAVDLANASAVTGALPVANGGTSATTARAAMAALKGVYILGQSGAASSHTGSTTETTLATITVPANAMGANGSLRITAQFSFSGAGGNRTPRLKFGGTTFVTQTGSSTSLSGRFQTQIYNQNATNAQIGTSTGQLNWATVTTAATTTSLDTTSAQDITITGELANAGDTITLEAYTVELLVP